MLETFRYLMLAIALIAPGDVRCNGPIYRATVCRVDFHNPAYTETLRPDNIRRVLTVWELKRGGE